ncbi:uncharacterized protein LOC125201092 [Salvia hispanica]|uniref:uncharacterized protein LOC125201092 n=1 Tax=Salvia hispanica TaxID=49212 RepID=UPI00200991E1|nr:uncharacterized protein LOC125201092 [Salvia hispanica]
MAKESRQVSEFTDFGGLLHFFKSKMIFEKEDFDLLRDYCDSDVDDDDVIEEKRQSVPFDKGPVLKYISQVRNSGGFDVDVKLHRWLDLGWFFIHLPLCDPQRHYYVYERAKLAIHEINIDMKSKTFELVKIVNAVKTRSAESLMFLTLAVKKVGAAEEDTTDAITIQAIVHDPFYAPWELKEWRVKPEVEEA